MKLLITKMVSNGLPKVLNKNCSAKYVNFVLCLLKGIGAGTSKDGRRERKKRGGGCKKVPLSVVTL